jgi:hypothetical protein
VVVIGWGQTSSKTANDPNPEIDDLERFGVGHRTLLRLKVPLVKKNIG